MKFAIEHEAVLVHVRLTVAATFAVGCEQERFAVSDCGIDLIEVINLQLDECHWQ